jgi:hypothetical protein
MAVRRSADWMALADDRILEILDAEGPHTPVKVSRDDRITWERGYINRRLLILADVELVQKDQIGRGVYTITDDGRAYLAGDLDARDLHPPEP